MDAVAEAALEAVAVEQRHEELEVLLLAVVRRRGHQQEVAGQGREELAEPVALGVLDLAAEEGGRHLVGLVADHEVPAAIGRLELLLHVLVAGQLVEAGDDEVGLQEPVAGARGFELVVGEDLEGQLEPAVELVLPLLGQAAGADDQAALEIAPGDQLLDQQPGHDRLAGARVVGEQEAERLPRQHRLVDRRDLVRQRIDHRGVDRQHGVEQMRQADPLRLGDQPEERAVAVEAPGPPLLGDLEPRLVVPVEQLVGRPCRPGPCRSARQADAAVGTGKEVVTPRSRGEVAAAFRERFDLGETRATSLALAHRSTVRYHSRRRDDARIRRRLLELAALRLRHACDLLWLQLRRKGSAVNRKRILRLYRLEQLGLQKKPRKKLVSAVSRSRDVAATAPSQRWSMDFMQDSLSTGRAFRLLNVLDEFHRESLAIEVDSFLPAELVVRVLDRLVTERGQPRELWVDNGPEFAGKALDRWAAEQGVEIRFIRPGRPVENYFIESFNGTLRQDCLEASWFDSLAEARLRIEAWRLQYNHDRPHTSLGGLAPAEFCSPPVGLKAPSGLQTPKGLVR